ncbi:hypothetical protein BH24DEI2_BH24DEI2_14630 [soil metagenome]
MNRFALCLLTALSFSTLTTGFAQADPTATAFAEFETNMFFVLRIADTDCPADFATATCYVRGYTNLFDFQDRFKALALGQLEEVSRWRFISRNGSADSSAP